VVRERERESRREPASNILKYLQRMGIKKAWVKKFFYPLSLPGWDTLCGKECAEIFLGGGGGERYPFKLNCIHSTISLTDIFPIYITLYEREQRERELESYALSYHFHLNYCHSRN
jgi:hypothetical protein